MEKEGRKLLEKLLKKYVSRGMKLLEIGCGNDEIMHELEKKFDVDVICVDPYGYGRRVIKIRAEEISSLSRKFNIIYSIQSFHHIADGEKFLEGAEKIILEGGKIILVDWKRGVDTGIPEQYFSLEEVKEKVEKIFRIIEKGEGRFHFYIVGMA